MNKEELFCSKINSKPIRELIPIFMDMEYVKSEKGFTGHLIDFSNIERSGNTIEELQYNLTQLFLEILEMMKNEVKII